MMNSSIKKRLVGNFMLVIIITVLILEFFLFNAVRQYYYTSVEEILSNQITFSSDFFSRYFPSNKIEDLIIDETGMFSRQTDAQVQILDLEGRVLLDSIGAEHSTDIINTSDVLKAIEGDKGTWIGDVEYDTSSVIAISHPLTVDGETIGILRYISSLMETNIIIRDIYKLLLIIGAMVIVISGIVSLFLANTIIRPLSEVTTIAEKMADGQLKIRSKKRFNDEIGKLSDTLNYMAEELIRKEQLKNDFISSVSHELRTPLTSIKGWAITLKSDESNDKRLLDDGLNIIEKESDRLSNMVDELLDFSKLASGRITVEKEEVNIVDAIEQIGKQFKPRANDKNIKFNITYQSDLPKIVADKNRMKQVLLNLLDNAFKYTPEDGEVTLLVSENNNNIIIKIEDNGSGIPEKDLPYITEKFYKGKNSKSSSGLGLSICNEIIKLHDGIMEIKSELNEGTMVIVSLPIKGVIGQ